MMTLEQLNERFAMHVILWQVLVACCREAMEREHNERLARRQVDHPDSESPIDLDGFPDY